MLMGGEGANVEELSAGFDEDWHRRRLEPPSLPIAATVLLLVHHRAVEENLEEIPATVAGAPVTRAEAAKDGEVSGEEKAGIGRGRA
jgi:hypothetical protein